LVKRKALGWAALLYINGLESNETLITPTSSRSPTVHTSSTFSEIL
jgi:hypothetical protein